MTSASNGGVRRYTDLLTTGYIKTGADGCKIFYPWGMLGNGYIFPTNDAYERLNDLLKVFTLVTLAIVLPVAMPGYYVAAVILLGLSLVFYAVWTSFEVRKLQRTDEKLTYGEGLTNIARLMPGWILWILEIMSLLLVAGALMTLIMEPSRWMVALSGIVFFGACAVLYAAMLKRRRHMANAQS